MNTDDLPLGRWADELLKVDGIEGVMLGGSRARGDHGPGSDVDLGLYYRERLDTAHLRSLATHWCGEAIDVTEPGGWGPWVDGGAWLVVDGVHVDWIYRDLDRVQSVWADCLNGRVALHHQVGHPFGFVDAAYAGEVSLGRVLADRAGQLTGLHQAVAVYPPALGKAIVGWLWESDFDIEIADKAISRRDTTYVAGCLFRAVMVCAHVLSAANGQWVLNEKGAVMRAAALPNSPARFEERAHHLLGRLGTTPETLRQALEDAGSLVADTRSAITR